MNKLVTRFLKDEDGATAIEYGLIAGLISAVIITVVGAIGGDVLGMFEAIDDGLG